MFRPELPSLKVMLLEITQVLLDEPKQEIACRRIDEIERRHVLAAGPDERLELRRSAARFAFAAATDKGAPFEAVSERFRVRCDLGFEESFSELALLVEYAHACCEFDEWETGTRVLDTARQRLAGLSSTTSNANILRQSELIERCQRRLCGEETTASDRKK